jgi:hypothetical protein
MPALDSGSESRAVVIDNTALYRRRIAGSAARASDHVGPCSVEPVTRREALRVAHLKWRWQALATLVVVAGVTACGSTSTASPTTGASTPTAPISTPTASTASGQCPSGATVGSALGITLPDAALVAGGSTQLPLGATGVACDYHGVSDNVIIELIANINPSYIAQFSGHFPVGFTSVPGVGDQARSFSQTLGGGKDNEGVVAVKGSNLVAIVATDTPASLAQVEALVNQLL